MVRKSCIIRNKISTHTLTWSVTNTPYYQGCCVYISTHTLTGSVTGVPQTWGGDYHNFNSHAHVERDGNAEKIKLFEKNFNSHAHVERDW